MKKVMVLALAICMVMMAALPALADEAKLSVTGSAVVALAPDMATVTIGVGSDGESVSKAGQDAAAIIAALIESLKAQGIADEDIQTASFYLNPRYNYTGDSQILIGYRVEHMLNVTVRDLDKVGALLDDAMAKGANQMYGINFASSKQHEAADEALQNAIKEAARKAELMAAAAGKTLAELEEINEQPNGYAVTYARSNKDMLSSAGGTQLQAGVLEISAMVELVYEVK
jgi:Uncharacterized conserved protein